MTRLRQGFGAQAQRPQLALRTIAILIAIAALIDPAWSTSRPPARELIALRLTSSDTSRVESALQQQLGDWTVTGRDVTSSRLPCAPSEHCVVIADGTIDIDSASDVGRPVPLIAIRPDEALPNVEVLSVWVTSGHQNATGTARIELRSRQMKRRTTELRVLDEGAIVGSAQIEWADEQTRSVDVAWWPIGSGARTLRIEAVPQAGEPTLDNAIDVGVAVRSGRAPVLVFDARPSWNSTFVRRALEDDPRFAVEHRARIAPALETGTPRARLDAAALDRAAVVIVGGLDALTAADVALLDRFTRIRGGTLILLPERPPAESMSAIVAGNWTEQLVAEPARIGPLRASETLQLRSPLAAATVIGQSGAFPAIVSTPAGDGRVVVSGAMDAWRYRHLDASAFDKFWQSLAAEGAAAGAPSRVTFDRDLAVPGSRAHVTLRHRAMTPSPAVEASAVWRCGGGPARSIRVWPTGTLGDFVGEVPVGTSEACHLEATINDQIVAAGMAVAARPARAISATLAKLERTAATSGAVVSSAGDEVAVARAVAAASRDSSRIVSVYPMRTAWWLLPFAGCLSIEWWLRRRAGLR